MWRSTGDICDSWESIRDLTLKQLPLQVYNGQNCFNDMDMLVVGMNAKGNVGFKGCTFEEYRSHFALGYAEFTAYYRLRYSQYDGGDKADPYE